MDKSVAAVSVERVLHYWRNQELKHHYTGKSRLPRPTGAAEAAIVDFEARVAPLPEELRELYRRSDGTPAGDCDKEGQRFWTLAEIRRDGRHPWLINFADYLQECWWYSFDSTGEGVHGLHAVYLWDGIKTTMIAPSMTDFFDLYVRDDAALYNRAT